MNTVLKLVNFAGAVGWPLVYMHTGSKLDLMLGIMGIAITAFELVGEE